MHIESLIRNYYYWILALIAIVQMLGYRDLNFLLILLIVYVAIIGLKTICWKPMDILIVLFLLYSLFSGNFSDYAFSTYYYGIKGQIIPMLFYFISRSKHFQNNGFYEQMKYPLAFVYLSAIFLYFLSPGWYVNFKTANLSAAISETAFYEFTRMSAFWSHSYFVGYSAVICIMYQLAKIVIKENYKKFDLLLLALAVFCLFFSQLRVCIAFLFLYFSFLTLYAFVRRLKASKVLLQIWICFIFVAIAIYVMIFSYMDSSYIDYVLSRTFDSDENIVAQRFDIFERFIARISIFGEGLGKYGHAALLLNKPSIADCEYIRLPVELGIIGGALFILIMLNTLIKGSIHLRHYFFEVFVLIFFLAAMIGATPLEMNTQQPFMLWFCIGQIVNNYKIAHK